MMEEKPPITLEDAMLLHEQSIAGYGGGAGVRDMEGLESALPSIAPLQLGAAKIYTRMFTSRQRLLAKASS